MAVVEKWGKDVKTATDLALQELKITEKEAVITVLESPSKGFLGLGGRLAHVRVEKKEEEKAVEELKEEKAASPVKSEQAPSKEEKKTSHRRERSRKSEAETMQIVKKPGDLKPVSDHPALEFLKDTIEQMGLKLDVKAEGNADNLYVYIEGKDASAIIGKRGATLDAIQYLMGLVANKKGQPYVRIVLDAKNYRARRERTLIQLSGKLSNKVRRSGRPVKLEPMNPFERMVIHAAVQQEDGVTTRSEGEEPYRRVIVEPEK